MTEMEADIEFERAQLDKHKQHSELLEAEVARLQAAVNEKDQHGQPHGLEQLQAELVKSTAAVERYDRAIQQIAKKIPAEYGVT